MVLSEEEHLQDFVVASHPHTPCVRRMRGLNPRWMLIPRVQPSRAKTVVKEGGQSDTFDVELLVPAQFARKLSSVRAPDLFVVDSCEIYDPRVV